jgi:hypothetical protein
MTEVTKPPEIAMDLIREQSMVGLAFDVMTVALYGVRTFSNDLESAHAINCASALLYLGFDDYTVSAMICHRHMRYTLKPHYKAVMWLAEETCFDVARLVEQSCFVPYLETNTDYFLKIREYSTSDYRILAIIATDWTEMLRVVQLGKEYHYGEDLMVITEVLPRIKANWNQWMEDVPSIEKTRIDAIWNTLFSLAEQVEYI